MPTSGDSFYSGTVRVVTSQSGVSVQHKAKRPVVEREGTVRNIPERQKKARSIGFASRIGKPENLQQLMKAHVTA